jgi:hypothetical protein
MNEKGPRPISNYVFSVLIAAALAGAIVFTWRMALYATTGSLG